MQIKVIYLEGSQADEEILAKQLEQGYKLHAALMVQGKVVAYLGRTSFGTSTEPQKAPVNTPPKNKNR